MRIGIFNTTLDACDAAAQFIINNFPKGGNLGVATGSTPLPLYLRLRAAYNRGEFDLSDAQAFALDEYVEIGSEDPQNPSPHAPTLAPLPNRPALTTPASSATNRAPCLPTA